MINCEPILFIVILVETAGLVMLWRRTISLKKEIEMERHNLTEIYKKWMDYVGAKELKDGIYKPKER